MNGASYSASFVMLRGNQAHGFAAFTVLPWDSEQIGVPAARIDYLVAEGSYAEQYQTKKELLDHVIVAADERGVRQQARRHPHERGPVRGFGARGLLQCSKATRE